MMAGLQGRVAKLPVGSKDANQSAQGALAALSPFQRVFHVHLYTVASRHSD